MKKILAALITAIFALAGLAATAPAAHAKDTSWGVQRGDTSWG